MFNIITKLKKCFDVTNHFIDTNVKHIAFKQFNRKIKFN